MLHVCSADIEVVLYLPIDFQTEASLGYAFVNMIDSSYVPKLQEKLTGFKKWRVPSKKICEVRLCGPWPDLEAHIERYRNSSVMHHTVPEDFKPALFENGKQIPFPKPSKAPKAPQFRRAPGPVGLTPAPIVARQGCRVSFVEVISVYEM
eukprot:Skav234141  [mRNA]  locus=scaffold361:49701:59037:- [translate_table: standard]